MQSHEQLLGHPLRVTIVVRKLADNLLLPRGDLILAHLVDLNVLRLPVMILVHVKLFVNKPNILANGESRRYLRKAEKIATLLSQAKQLQRAIHVHVGLHLETFLQVNDAGAVDNIVKVLIQFLPVNITQIEILLRQIHGDNTHFSPQELAVFFSA